MVLQRVVKPRQASPESLKPSRKVGRHGLPDTPIGLGGKMDDTSVVVGEALGTVFSSSVSSDGVMGRSPTIEDSNKKPPDFDQVVEWTRAHSEVWAQAGDSKMQIDA